MESGAATDRAVAFYSGAPDNRGRTLDEIMRWPDDDLERVHDYIQWMFPTVQASAVNPSAPLITGATSSAFAGRPDLRQKLAAAFDRMLRFYGLRRVRTAAARVRVEVDSDRFIERARVWLRPGNHNHLRLTRIMQSLAALGLREEALALQRCLTSDIFEGPGRNRITRETHEYWMGAV